MSVGRQIAHETHEVKSRLALVIVGEAVLRDIRNEFLLQLELQRVGRRHECRRDLRRAGGVALDLLVPHEQRLVDALHEVVVGVDESLREEVGAHAFVGGRGQ